MHHDLSSYIYKWREITPKLINSKQIFLFEKPTRVIIYKQ